MAAYPRSIVEYCGWRESGRCGYCGSPDLKCSHGMWAHCMTVQDYQDLIDRGWRRSGKYVYKPTMNLTCCPQYPIRCKVQEFKLRKSHKKIIKSFNTYLNCGKKPEKCLTSKHDFISFDRETETDNFEFIHNKTNVLHSISIENPQNQQSLNSNETSLSSTQKCSDSDTATKLSIMEISFTEESKPFKSCRLGSGPDPNKPKCIKKKILRKEKFLQKQNLCNNHQTNNNKTNLNNLPKTVENFLNEFLPQSALKLEIKLVRSSPQSQQFKDTFDKSFHIYKKYQMEIHKDPENKITSQQFTRFLVDSPLQECHDTQYEPGFGSFHQQYWLGDELIAVGVIDILPQCVSSVYFYYDPSYHFLTLGTYSALREIAFTRHINSIDQNVQFYYMGYYIHSCSKMRYKGQYSPSFLSCPETYKWYSIDDCEVKLDDSKYSRFAPNFEKDDQDIRDISNVSILYRNNVLTYKLYSSINKYASDADEVLQYAKLVGSKVSENLLLYRSS